MLPPVVPKPCAGSNVNSAVSNVMMLSKSGNIFASSGLLITTAVLVTIGLFLFNTRLSASLLVASWKAPPSDIGIPGITKTYVATLTNRGILPVRINVCEYQTDVFEQEQSVADWIDRWDQSSGRWKLFWEIPSDEFCKQRAGSGPGEPKLRTNWLWPRESITNPFIASQASDGLQLNDSLRFVFTPFLDRRELVIATDPFRVDERPTVADAALVIRH